MFTINFLLALFLSYLVGSIPSGVIVAKIFNLGDVRKQGSGNIGGTNIARIGGKKLGLLTIGFDVLKGILPISMLEHYHFGELATIICGAATVLGHIFPVWLRFKGGKGVATTLGVLLMLDPWVSSIFASTWLITFAASHIPSLASILAALLSIIGSYFMQSTHKIPSDIFLVYFALFLMILWRHRDNMMRLYRHEEKPIFFVEHAEEEETSNSNNIKKPSNKGNKKKGKSIKTIKKS
jgi:acyl phosphate:glycerol-3-phosphate acyltransferase